MIDMLFLELIPVEFFVDVEGVVILLFFFVGTISGNRELSLHIRQHLFKSSQPSCSVEV